MRSHRWQRPQRQHDGFSIVTGNVFSSYPPASCVCREADETRAFTGLIGGPDVWEVAMWMDDLRATDDPTAELAADGAVSRPQIDAALAYRATYPDEVEARIELHRSETAAAEAR